MNKTVANNKGASPLRRALKAVKEMSARLEKFERSAKEPIAIIGMGCRFPGNVNTPEEFWQLLRDGRDAVAEIPSERWDVDAYYADDPDAVGKMYTRCGGMLKEVDKFEPQFFGISPREAVGMDPQQRLLLEVSWEALERAGQNPQQLAGSQTGVFIGISSVDYATLLTQFRDPSLIDAYTGTGVSLSVAAGFHMFLACRVLVSRWTLRAPPRSLQCIWLAKICAPENVAWLWRVELISFCPRKRMSICRGSGPFRPMAAAKHLMPLPTGMGVETVAP
jgi:hypothetical protein